jgi:predicted transposase/invertase (TIGR01784 family)
LIALLEDFTLEGNPDDKYLHDICLCNRETGEIFYEKLGYTYIELLNFVKAEEQLETDLDKWLYVLKNMSRMDKIPAYLRKPIFEKLFSIAEYTNLTKEEKNMYDSSMKHKWDNKNVLDYAIEEAKSKGKLEGKIEGKLEEARKIARELKKEGLTVEFIAKTTKLSNEEIEKL